MSFLRAELEKGLVIREEEPTTHREWDEMSGCLLEDILEVGTIPTEIEWELQFGARAKALLFYWNRRIVQEAIAVLGPYLNYGTAP